MDYGFLYRLYLKSMSRATHRSILQAEHERYVPPQSSTAFEVADAIANQHGNAYRGAGVLIGLLSILVVFIAVTPAGFHIANESVLVVLGFLKVGLMTLILGLVYLFGLKSRHHQEWIQQRHHAESLRYAQLKELKESLVASLSSDESELNSKAFFEEIKQILAGPGGQIAYNRRKADQYKSIEHFSGQLSWYGFMFAFFCALWLLLSELHLVPHTSLLIFGTAAVPALVGGIHGINGLLKIESLAEEHYKMASVLNGLNEELNHANPIDGVAILNMGERAYSHLVDRDVQWSESVEKINIKPA